MRVASGFNSDAASITQNGGLAENGFIYRVLYILHYAVRRMS